VGGRAAAAGGGGRSGSSSRARRCDGRTAPVRPPADQGAGRPCRGPYVSLAIIIANPFLRNPGSGPRDVSAVDIHTWSSAMNASSVCRRCCFTERFDSTTSARMGCSTSNGTGRTPGAPPQASPSSSRTKGLPRDAISRSEAIQYSYNRAWRPRPCAAPTEGGDRRWLVLCWGWGGNKNTINLINYPWALPRSACLAYRQRRASAAVRPADSRAPGGVVSRPRLASPSEAHQPCGWRAPGTRPRTMHARRLALWLQTARRRQQWASCERARPLPGSVQCPQKWSQRVHQI
jgi:hypothetical protein